MISRAESQVNISVGGKQRSKSVLFGQSPNFMGLSVLGQKQPKAIESPRTGAPNPNSQPKFDPNISKILRVPELDPILTSGVLVEGVRNRITAYNYIIFQLK